MAGCSSYAFTEKEFVDNARQMIDISRAIGDKWEVHNITGADPPFYLVKKTTVILPESRSDDGTDQDSCVEEHLEIEEDDQAMSQSSCTTGEVCTFEYHVVYSASYSVPVLYFNAYRTNGCLLSLEDLWKSLPKIHQSHLVDDRWSFLTQQEHPVLCRPFYQLHPCKTGQLLHLMGQCTECYDLTSERQTKNSLVLWLSTVGPIVHLDIPLQYGVHILSNKELGHTT